jgi:glycosyltransferase involved in cell wall biosynthesis
MVNPMRLNIGFVSTRFAGIDGVSLEASKWARVLEGQGHACYWFAGELARSEPVSLRAAEADFKDEHNQWINSQLFASHKKSLQLARIICNYKSTIAARLKLFIDMYRLDCLVVENALAIPMHIPLGLALTDVIAETGIPTIAHHHDFYWERKRYLPLNGSRTYIHRAFPPRLPNIAHVVINSRARANLARLRGIRATVIPNVLDFENRPPADTERIRALRHSIGLKPDDMMLLQPTRIVQRKGIEATIQLVKELDHPRYKVVVSHEAGDEGFEYASKIKRLARESGVNLRFIDHMVTDPYAPRPQSNDRFSLWEVYHAADFVTYPSLYEGFGNAFLEAIYFNKPLLVNRYKIFAKDIEPKGFDVVKMDGRLTAGVVADIKHLLHDKKRRAKMTAKNYRLASRHYSFATLRHELTALLADLFPHHCRARQECPRAAAGS